MVKLLQCLNSLSFGIASYFSKERKYVQDWFMCKGSKPGTRGYTCGLWLLLHSLAARVEPASNGGANWMSAIKCEHPPPPPSKIGCLWTSQPAVVVQQWRILALAPNVPWLLQILIKTCAGPYNMIPRLQHTIVQWLLSCS